MSEIAVVHESYSFACMRCGHGWEQSYVIEHHVDADGREFVQYVVNDQVVPSPLSRPACSNCDNHVIRIMRPGRVASARDAAHRPQPTPPAGPVEVPTAGSDSGAGGAAGVGAEGGQKEVHHWHLSDFLHSFQRKAS
ncbi:hypothetical protein M2271_005702 [Streptomyces sp. LBL]|uniref:hypothetical protein n=1 Tax=Streptomyces sp. LBL TaxID=2940562 RepID=UPI00247651EB|nr:hypothetical protein [Streptomyces sp. LBL]MDH6627873.1 hypothetical protein [Streptomyces sp. LBL]